MSVNYLIALSYFAKRLSADVPTAGQLALHAEELDERFYARIRTMLRPRQPTEETLAYIGALASMATGSAATQVSAAVKFFEGVAPELPMANVPRRPRFVPTSEAARLDAVGVTPRKPAATKGSGKKTKVAKKTKKATRAKAARR